MYHIVSFVYHVIIYQFDISKTFLFLHRPERLQPFSEFWTLSTSSVSSSTSQLPDERKKVRISYGKRKTMQFLPVLQLGRYNTNFWNTTQNFCVSKVLIRRGKDRQTKPVRLRKNSLCHVYMLHEHLCSLLSLFNRLW